MSNETLNYTVSDYSNVNDALLNESRRMDEMLRVRRARRLTLYGDVILKAACALGVLIVASGIFYWLLISDGLFHNYYFDDGKSRAIIANELSHIRTDLVSISESNALLEKEIAGVEAGINAIDAISKEAMLKKISESIEPDHDGSKLSTRFTVFHTYEIDDLSEVVTGWIYLPDNLDIPSQQYCYYTLVQINGKSLRTDLAIKYQSDLIKWNEGPELEKVGRTHCNFRETSVSAVR